MFGRRPGAPVCRIGRDPGAPWVTSRGPRHAHLEGFDLHANRTVRSDDRAGLERLCQYLLRPPLAQARIERLADGRVLYTLTHPWTDGTRQLLLQPLELLEKLAVLVPRPHINLVLYHGVLAAHARDRAETVRTARPPPDAAVACPASASERTAQPIEMTAPAVPACSEPAMPVEKDPATTPPRRRWAWADLLRRVFAIDVLACACGGRLRLIATIEDPPVVQRILLHLGLPSELPALYPARPPPGAGETLAFDFPG